METKQTLTIYSWFGDHMLMPPGKFFTMFHFLVLPLPFSFLSFPSELASPN